MASSRSLVAAAAIVDSLATPTQLLAARRSAPKALAGQWEFPGGKVEPAEDPLAALRRELREELGIEVNLGAEVPPPTGDSWPILQGMGMRVWLAEISDGDPAPLEDHDALAWLPFAEVDTVAWLEPDVPIVAAVRRLCMVEQAADIGATRSTTQ